MPKKSIIPIYYVGGTAGTLIAALLTAAKTESAIDPVVVDDWSTMHRYTPDYAVAWDPPWEMPLDLLIDHTVIEPKPTTKGPYYVNYHPKVATDDLVKARPHFEKTIAITYTTRDIPELAKIRLGKMPKLQRSDSEESTYRDQVMFLMKMMVSVRNMKAGSTDQLTWETIIRGDLLTELSNISGMPRTAFENTELLLEYWRSRTLEIVKQFDRSTDQ